MEQTKALIINPLRLFAALYILALVSILFIDKPLALYIHSHGFDSFLQLRMVTEGVPLTITIIAILFLFSKHYKTGVISSLFLVIYFYLTLKATLQVKVFLKVIFGRYWPKTWINNNLSLVHDGVYGFNWLHGFGNQGSFPSGHSTYVMFCCFWLIYFFPKLKPLWYLTLVIMVASLVTLDYHFLGDCFAGIGLGCLCSGFSIYLWEKVISGKFKIKKV